MSVAVDAVDADVCIYVWSVYKPSPQAVLSLVLIHEKYIVASLLERRKKKTEETEEDTFCSFA